MRALMMTLLGTMIGLTGCFDDDHHGTFGGPRPFPVPEDDAGPPETPERCREPTPNQVWNYGYDDRGRLVTANDRTFDYDAVGALVAIETPSGTHEIDRDADGAWTAYRFRTPDGKRSIATVVSRSADRLEIEYRGLFQPGFVAPAPAFDVDAYPELAEAAPTYDLADQVQIGGAAYPEGGGEDLVIELDAELTFDALGRPTGERLALHDSAAYLRVTTIEYTDEATTTRIEWSGETSRAFERVVYGDAEAPDRETRDVDGDGRVDVINTWTRGPAFELFEEDTDADGVVDRRTRVEFNLQGDRVLKTIDEDADGQVEWRKRYVYDAEGRRLFEARDRDGNGLIDERWDYTYDEAGRLVSERRSDPRVGECGVDWE